jgi:hypothetical protein
MDVSKQRSTIPTEVTDMDRAPDRPDGEAKQAYTEENWEEESYALLAERADPNHCPNCGLTGFFGPRARDDAPKFRECRFCGFYQEVGQQPKRRRPVAHGCDEWPEIAGAPYIWWIAPDERFFVCAFCGQRAPAETSNVFMKGAGITAPSDDPGHPWWNVPQDESYSFYYNFWEQWPSTKGRVVF